jgi:beta-lactamase regulating signal transducer with metallopeptidase domain/tetratricopeptide (TPR) repeat protein
MNIAMGLDSAFCVRVVLTLLHFLWQGTVVALLIAPVVVLLRSASPKVRYNLYVLALFLMALCPLATFTFLRSMTVGMHHAQDWTVMSPAGLVVPTPVVGETPPLQWSLRARVNQPRARLATGPTPTQSAVQTVGQFDWRQYAPHAVVGYLIGVFLMLGRVVLALCGGNRLRRQSQPVTEPTVLEALKRAVAALGLRVVPAVTYCARVAMPTVIGVLRPAILLPMSLMSGLSPDQIEMLLLHELAHIRRYDHIINIVQRLIEALLFFHPAVWFVSRRIRVERELCCDDLVVAAGGQPLAYAASLVQMAELSLSSQVSRRLQPAALGAGEKPSQLRRRIHRLLDDPMHEAVRLTRAWVVIAAITVVATCAAVTGLSSQAAKGEAVGVSQAELQRLLDEAIGFASVWNYEKAEEICDRVLASTKDRRIQARAHWTKAVAYQTFQINHRTDRLQDKFEAEREAVRRLAPQLLADDIARLEALLPFYLSEKPDVKGVLDQTRRSLLAAESSGKRQPLSDENQLSDPVNIYRLGQAYRTAAALTSGTLEEESRQYLSRARDLLQKAAEQKPDSYEFASHYLTALADLGVKEEAIEVGKKIAARFDGKLPYPPLGDSGPFCLYAAAISKRDPYKAMDMLQERAQTPLADAWVHLEVAKYQESKATSATEKARIWGDLARRIETGEIQTPGTNFRVLANAYYRLAHFKSVQAASETSPERAGQLWREMLATYQKLAAISPHYAELHTNLGICSMILGQHERDSAQAKTLFAQARKEFELQQQYDWHFGRARNARQCLRSLVWNSLLDPERSPFTSAELIERAYLFEEDPARRAEFYSLVGRQCQRQMTTEPPENQAALRRQAAESYLNGLSGVLAHDLPATSSAQLPNSVWLLPDTAEREKAIRQHVLAGYRETLTRATVELYAKEPDAFDELRETARKYPGTAEAADQLVVAAKAYRKDKTAPIPVLKSVGQKSVGMPTTTKDEVTPAAPPPRVDPSDKPPPKTVSLNVKDAPLAEVIQQLARQAGLNVIVKPEDVRGRRVTADFDDVPVMDALRSILRTNELELILDSDGVRRIIPRSRGSSDPGGAERESDSPIPRESASVTSPPANLIAKTYSVRKSLANDLKIIVEAILSAEGKFAGKPEAKEYRVVLAEHEAGADLIVKAADEDIRKVEELLQDREFLGRVERHELEVYTVNLTPRDVLKAYPEQIEGFKRDAITVIETMLYHKEGVAAARKQGRQLWYDPKSMQLTIVDTPENIKKVREFVESLPQLRPPSAAVQGNQASFSLRVEDERTFRDLSIRLLRVNANNPADSSDDSCDLKFRGPTGELLDQNIIQYRLVMFGDYEIYVEKIYPSPTESEGRIRLRVTYRPESKKAVAPPKAETTSGTKSTRFEGTLEFDKETSVGLKAGK